MKKHLSLIAALCALLAGCAKETPGPKDEPQAEMITVTIGASVQENTKTTIGEKDGDKYPVLWSDDDQIAVNGVASDEVVISEDKKTAYFKATVQEAENYTVVYPYTEGNASNEVTFSGLTLPSYGITDLTEDVVLQPLYGVLKLSLKGAATINRIVLSTQDGAQVTGKFEIGAEGVLTGKDADATALVYCPEPVALDAETPAVFFIPVPAGTYNIFDVQIFDNEGTSMTKKIGGGNNYAVGAGKVIEFPAFEYKVNQHMFAIASTSDLEQFAALVTEGTFSAKYESAVVAKDIVAPETWTSLDYSGVFDGGNKTITTSVPLFGTLTSAKVSNVNIAASTMNCVLADLSTDRSFGALAKTMTGTTVVDNCNVSGDINISLQGDATKNTFRFGCVAGYVNGGTIQNCGTTANLTFNHPGSNTAKFVLLGSIAGEIGASSTIKGCKVGDGLLKTNDNNGNTNVTMFVGGIVGYMSDGTSTVDSCELKKKTLDTGVGLSVRMDVSTYRVGGIAGVCNGAIKDCINNQGVSLSKAAQKVTYALIGGTVGTTNYVIGKGAGTFTVNITNTTNSGTLFFANASNNTVAQTIQLRMGGIVGSVAAKTSISKCTNTALVEYGGDASKATWLCLGGVVGSYENASNTVTIDGWVNRGRIYVHPTAAAIGAAGATFQLAIGGLAGTIRNVTGITYGTNPSSNSGVISIEKAVAPTPSAPSATAYYNFAYIGGCIGAYRGTGATTYKLLENTGNIVVADGLEGIMAGGLLGHAAAGGSSKCTFDGCNVKCTITSSYTRNDTTNNIYAGAALVTPYNSLYKTYQNCKLGGTVNGTKLTSENFNEYLFIGTSATDGGGNTFWE